MRLNLQPILSSLNPSHCANLCTDSNINYFHQENTYLYLASLQLLYLDLLLGEKHFFPPPPSAFIQADYLIFYYQIFFIFLPVDTLMYIRYLMYPVQMPSLMNIIFANKQRIMFFDPPYSLISRG